MSNCKNSYGDLFANAQKVMQEVRVGDLMDLEIKNNYMGIVENGHDTLHHNPIIKKDVKVIRGHSYPHWFKVMK